MSAVFEPSSAICEVRRDLYQADLELLDRYVGFSVEIARISTLGLAAIGFAMQYLLKDLLVNMPGSKLFMASAVVLLGVSIAAALGHRFFATDGMFYLLRSLRGGEREASRAFDSETMIALFKLSSRLLAVAAISASVGSVSLACSVLLILVDGIW